MYKWDLQPRNFMNSHARARGRRGRSMLRVAAHVQIPTARTISAPVLSSISWPRWGQTTATPLTHTHSPTHSYSHTYTRSHRTGSTLQCLDLCSNLSTILYRTAPLCCGRPVKSWGNSPPLRWVMMIFACTTAKNWTIVRSSGRADIKRTPLGLSDQSVIVHGQVVS